MLGVEQCPLACSELDLLLKALSNTCSEVWAGGMCWRGLKHKAASVALSFAIGMWRNSVFSVV